MTPRQLTASDWFGTHTLAENCTVQVVATRKAEAGEPWMGQHAEETVLPAGTVIRMESATSEAVCALLGEGGAGIAIRKAAIGQIVVQ